MLVQVNQSYSDRFINAGAILEPHPLQRGRVLHTASDQKLEAGTAWERGYKIMERSRDHSWDRSLECS